MFHQVVRRLTLKKKIETVVQNSINIVLCRKFLSRSGRIEGERARASVRVCECVCERASVCVCVCDRQRERENVGKSFQECEEFSLFWIFEQII